MATVYRARDTALRREVAVKVLFPHLARKDEVVKRFQREARAAAKLDHPNILRVLDVGGGPGTGSDGRCDPPYIVLELIEGESLRELIGRAGPLPAEAVAAIGAVIARALGVAHRAGIVHRDIKPANVMVAEGGRLVIADFGVAHLADEDSVVTRTGALLGTPAFMSPEQASAEDLDARSDLYSLGATLYRLATGAMPFSGPTARVVGAIVRGDFVEPLRRTPTMGPDLAAAIERLMALDPGDRYADASAAEAALLEVAGREQPDELLVELFADLERTRERLDAEAVERSLEEARQSADEGRIPRAIALADRVLAFEPEHPEALALVDRVSRRPRGGRWMAGLAAVALAAAAAGAGAWQMGALGGGKRSLVMASAPPAGAPDAAVAVEPPAPDASPVAAEPVDAGVIEVARAKPEPRRTRPAAARRASEGDREGEGEGEGAGEGDAEEPAVDAGPIGVAPKPPRIPTGSLAVQIIGGACDVFIDGTRRATLRGKKTFADVRTGPREVRCAVRGGKTFTERAIVVEGNTSSVVFRNQVTVVNRSGTQVRHRGRTYGHGQTMAITPASRVRLEFLQPDQSWEVGYVKVRGDCALTRHSCR